MSFSIEGKTAVVTGAANGVGLSIARHFVDRGANVMFADMDEDRLDEELAGEEDTPNIASFGGDLRQKLTVANLLSATIDAFERVDILVNASRQMVPGNPLKADEDQVALLLEQNLMTSLRLSQGFARRMIAQAEDDDEEDGSVGSIINLSSIAARRAQPQLLGYSIASAAVEQMTRSLAVALAPKRIRVNAIALGSVMSASLQRSVLENDDYRETIISHTPLSRIAGPTELADVAQFLASDGSGFLTGQILTVDGGRTLLDPVDVPAH